MWTVKIERAKQHKEELQKEIKSFFDSQPYKIDTKSDPQSKRLIYYLVKADVVPEKIALITGDVMQNLRSSLDHLAYMLFTVGPGNGTQGHHIYFPIAESYSDEGGLEVPSLTISIKPYSEDRYDRLPVIDPEMKATMSDLIEKVAAAFRVAS